MNHLKDNVIMLIFQYMIRTRFLVHQTIAAIMEMQMLMVCLLFSNNSLNKRRFNRISIANYFIQMYVLLLNFF